MCDIRANLSKTQISMSHLRHPFALYKYAPDERAGPRAKGEDEDAAPVG